MIHCFFEKRDFILRGLFNERHNTPHSSVTYGTITTAFDWLFIKIEGKRVIVDNKRYFISDLPQLLGVLEYIVNP